MKIQIVSDLNLHINQKMPIIKKTDADVIVMAGDVSNGYEKESAYAKKIANAHKKKVIIVNGNHSFHNKNLYDEQKKWRNSRIPNVKYLDHTTGFIFEGVNFLGGTLWVDYSDKPECWVYTADNGSDFSSIKVSNTGLFTPDISSHQHLLLRDHFGHNISANHTNVIITHYPPSYDSYKGSPDERGSCHFATNLDDFINEHDIALWIHGGSHHSLDYRLGNTQIVCNPFGKSNTDYSQLNAYYNPGLVIEV